MAGLLVAAQIHCQLPGQWGHPPFSLSLSFPSLLSQENTQDVFSQKGLEIIA